MRHKVAAIVGATAVGKTETSLRVAGELGAEIVSVDSMQLYRHMDIGTAKPTREEQDLVPHHLLDLYPPSAEISVAEFQNVARGAIEDIASRHRLPLLVGGSGLYFRAVVDDLRFPPRSPDVRTRLEIEAERLGADEMHQRLARRDPVAAERIDPSNARRVIRALEVIELTGKPFSDADAWDEFDSHYELRVAGLERSRDDLSARVVERVDRMLARGLEPEARRVHQGGMSRTARQALGYKQILDAPPGIRPQEVREQIVRATRRFARRQESWFRADPRVVWFDAADPSCADAIVSYFKRELALP